MSNANAGGAELSGGRWMLWVVPIAVMVWVILFLLTPDLKPIRASADALPAMALTVLLAAAWSAGRWFSRSGLSARMGRAREHAPHEWGCAVIVSAALFPLTLCAIGKYYWIHVGALTLIYVMLSIGLNIVVGFSGLLVLGFSAFYGIGAYVAAILTVKFPAWPHLIWLLIPVAALAAAFFGIVLGAPTLRLRGDYLAIVTMGFGEIVRIVFTNWDGLTRGPLGISGVAPLHLFGWNLSRPFEVGPLRIDGDTQYYYVLLAFASFFGLMAHRLNLSRYGRAWVAMREDELAASCYGVDVATGSPVVEEVYVHGAGLHAFILRAGSPSVRRCVSEDAAYYGFSVRAGAVYNSIAIGGSWTAARSAGARYG